MGVGAGVAVTVAMGNLVEVGLSIGVALGAFVGVGAGVKTGVAGAGGICDGVGMSVAVGSKVDIEGGTGVFRHAPVVTTKNMRETMNRTTLENRIRMLNKPHCLTLNISQADCR